MDYTRLLRLPQYFRNLQRLSEIVAVLVKHGFGDVVDRIRLPRYLKGKLFMRPSGSSLEEKRNIDLSVRLRMVFEELGPTFIKFGQIIATRPDVFPDSIIREFRKLQDRVAPFPLQKAREIIRAELGQEVEKVFSSFEESPLAAASLAQVHKARLLSGEVVVVKVQRPSLLRIIETDVDILKGIAALLEEYIPESRTFNPSILVEEFARALKKECDFGREVQSLLRFADNFGSDENVRVPRVYRSISTKRLIVEEFIEGVRADRIDAISGMGIDTAEVARVIERVVLKSVFEFRLFHADPHPGNILVTRDGKVAFVDFGKMGRINRSRAQSVIRFLLAVTTADVEGVCRFLYENQMAAFLADDFMLKNQIGEILDFYNSQTLGELELSQLVSDVFEVIRRYGLKPSPDLLSIGRVLSTLQAVGKNLDPSYNPTEAARPYLQKRHLLELADPEWQGRRMLDVVNLYRRLLTDAPLQVREILRKLAGNELTIRQESQDLPRVLSHQNALLNRFLMALIGCALLTCGMAFMLFADSAIESTAAYVLMAWGALLCLLVWLAVRKTGGMT